MSATRWDQELRAAGFAGIDSLAYDGYLNNNIIAMPSTPVARSKRVTLLMRDRDAPATGPVLDLERHLVQSGYRVDRLTLGEMSTRGLPPNQDIVSTLELEGPFFKDLQEHKMVLWEQFVGEVRNGDHKVLWLTRPSRVNNCADPEYGVVIGLARALRNEESLGFATVELESLDDSTLECAVNILKEFHNQLIEDSVQPTAEWAIVGGKALIGRYQPIKVAQELRGCPEDSTLPDWLAEMLRPVEAELQQLGPDDVGVAVKAVGLSFEVSRSNLPQTHLPTCPLRSHGCAFGTNANKSSGSSHDLQTGFQGS